MNTETKMIFSADALIDAVLHPAKQITKPKHLLHMEQFTGRRDPLTELQQKLLTKIIFSLLGRTEQTEECRLRMAELYEVFSSADPAFWAAEIEKLSVKGIWIYQRQSGRLFRVPWFAAIGFWGDGLIFSLTPQAAKLIRGLTPEEAQYRLLKGIQYRGKHTLAVFSIIWGAERGQLTEYSIAELMQRLSLEHTRYSYGQLKLRVLEPSLQEIYAWDQAIFVRFGPTFSGRRVEGIWFEVTTGEKALQLREKEPEFRFSSAREKPLA